MMLSVAALAEVLAYYIPYYDGLVNSPELLAGRETRLTG
jgi:hypothetical protein